MCVGHVCLNFVGLYSMFVMDLRNYYVGLDCMFVMNYVELCVFAYVMDGFLLHSVTAIYVLYIL